MFTPEDVFKETLKAMLKLPVDIGEAKGNQELLSVSTFLQNEAKRNENNKSLARFYALIAEIIMPLEGDGPSMLTQNSLDILQKTPLYMKRTVDRVSQGAGISAPTNTALTESLNQLSELERKIKENFTRRYEFADVQSERTILYESFGSALKVALVSIGASATVVGLIPLACRVAFKAAEEVQVTSLAKKAKDLAQLQDQSYKEVVKEYREVYLDLLNSRFTSFHKEAHKEAGDGVQKKIEECKEKGTHGINAAKTFTELDQAYQDAVFIGKMLAKGESFFPFGELSSLGTKLEQTAMGLGEVEKERAKYNALCTGLKVPLDEFLDRQRLLIALNEKLAEVKGKIKQERDQCRSCFSKVRNYALFKKAGFNEKSIQVLRTTKESIKGRIAATEESIQAMIVALKKSPISSKINDESFLDLQKRCHAVLNSEKRAVELMNTRENLRCQIRLLEEEIRPLEKAKDAPSSSPDSQETESQSHLRKYRQ